MGLDMYLNGKRFLFNVDEKDKERSQVIMSMFPELKEMKSHYGDEPVKGVTIEVGYWRKANAIHDWFVNNVQDGNDDCGYYYVNRKDLEDLRYLCQQALDNPENADEILPTQDGFFFGSTDYNDWYMENLKSTIAIIDNALALPIEWDFEYHSSW